MNKSFFTLRFTGIVLLFSIAWLQPVQAIAQQPSADSATISRHAMPSAQIVNIHSGQWAGIAGSFKKIRNFLGVAGQPITNYTWVVPAGVSTIMIECWGGGEAARSAEGGAGGNYYMVVVPIAAGTTLQIAVGDGGRGDGDVNGRLGRGSTVSWMQSASSFFVTAFGGNASTTVGSDQLPSGSYRYGVLGSRGQPADYFFNRKSQFTNTVQVYGGTGGGSFGFPFNGGAGHNYNFIEILNTLDVYSNAAHGAVPGGGAGGGMGGTYSVETNQYSHGGAGMVLVRW